MRILLTGALLSFLRTSIATPCVSGPFTVRLEKECSFEAFVDAFQKIYEDPILVEPGCTNTIQEDLDEIGITVDTVKSFCVDAKTSKISFTSIGAAVGGDFLFPKTYFDGGTYWNEEVETILDSDNGRSSNVLKDYAAVVDGYYEVLHHQAAAWPDDLSNFDLDGCEINAAMCCWVQDRQANDNNGNCAKPYDTNCVDKDPADNTDLCFVDLEKAPDSNFVKANGITVFPGDNDDGEGAIHCHGQAWSNDVSDFTHRYKANNLFYISMYDHLYKRGYVRNVPGAPMCGCVEKMPVVTRSDCTQIDVVEESYVVHYSPDAGFSAEITHAEIEFNSCRGVNQNNDLSQYFARLYNEGKVTLEQKYKLRSHLVENGNCPQATAKNLAGKGIVRGFPKTLYSQVMTFPETKGEFVHGFCVVGASSAGAFSTDDALEYKAYDNFESGARAWADRTYFIDGVENTICAGSIFLQPSRHKTIDSFTEITVGANPINNSVQICAFVEANRRDANWPEILLSEDPRTIDYGADTGLAWVYQGTDQKFHLLCKELPEGPTMAPTKAPTRVPSSSQLAQEVSIELPQTTTSQLVHGLCATNVNSASARSNFAPLTYSGVAFNEGVRSWNDRSYKTVNIEGGPCEGGTFLRPSRHKAIPRGTLITIDLERSRGDDEMTVCVFTSDWRDGGFPTTLRTLGFTPRDSKRLAWLFRSSEQMFTLLCKEV